MKSTTRIWYSFVLVLGLLSTPFLLRGAEELIGGAASWALLLLVAGVWFGLHRTVRLSKGEFHSVYTLDDAPTFAIIFLFLNLKQQFNN